MATPTTPYTADSATTPTTPGAKITPPVNGETQDDKKNNTTNSFTGDKKKS